MLEYPEKELFPRPKMQTSYPASLRHMKRLSPPTSAHTAPRSRHTPEEDELRGPTHLSHLIDYQPSSRHLKWSGSDHTLTSWELMREYEYLHHEQQEIRRAYSMSSRPESPPREHRYLHYSPDHHRSRPPRLETSSPSREHQHCRYSPERHYSRPSRPDCSPPPRDHWNPHFVPKVAQLFNRSL